MIESLPETIQRLSKQSQPHLQALQFLFQYRPYPTIDQVNTALNSLSASTGAFHAYITQYDLDPFDKRKAAASLAKQFDTSHVRKTIQAIKREPEGSPLDVNEQVRLSAQFTYMNTFGKNKLAYYSREKLLSLSKELFLKIKASDFNDPDKTEEREKVMLTLLALAREVLFRTTGKFPNSTQMLTALLSLHYPGNLLLQLNTGEGKSILSPLLLLLEWAKGGTINNCTANDDLARRDQKSAALFFDFFDAKSQFIDADCPMNSYAIGGINCATLANTSLYRSNAKLFGESLRVKETPQTSLLIDECDASILDDRTAYNLASGSAENPYAFIYPLINEFIDQPAYQNIDPSKNPVWDTDQDIYELKQFLLKNITDSKKIKIINRLLDTKYKTWLESATIAKQHREGIEFIVQQTTCIIDNKEVRVDIAVPLDKNIPQAGSTRERGVQQFLHARLQKEESKKHPNQSFNFPIDNESLKTASETAKNYIHRLVRKGGRLIGLSATPGSTVELAEQMSAYQVNTFSMPPHETSLRKILKTKVSALQDKHMDEILRTLNKKDDAEPQLVICQNTESAEQLYQYLKEKLKLPKEHLQLVSGKEDIKDRENIVGDAGKNGRITVSTSLLGRGTDIETKHKKGLLVIQTYLDNERTMKQIMGRAARNGKKGFYRLILNRAGIFSQYDINLSKSKKTREKSLRAIFQNIDEEAAIERYYVREMDRILNIQLKYLHRWHKFLLKLNPNNSELERTLLEKREAIIDETRETWQALLESSDPDKDYPNLYIRRNENGELAREALDDCIQALEENVATHWEEDLKALESTYLPSTNHLPEVEKARYDRLKAFNMQSTLLSAQTETGINEEKLTTPLLSENTVVDFRLSEDETLAELTYSMHPEENATKVAHAYLNILPTILDNVTLNKEDRKALLIKIKEAMQIFTKDPVDLKAFLSWACDWINQYHAATKALTSFVPMQRIAINLLTLTKKFNMSDENITKLQENYLDHLIQTIETRTEESLSWRKGPFYQQIERNQSKQAADAILQKIKSAKNTQNEIEKLQNIYQVLLVQKIKLRNTWVFGLFHENIKKTIDQALNLLQETANLYPDHQNHLEAIKQEVLAETNPTNLTYAIALKNRLWQTIKEPHQTLRLIRVHTGFKEYAQLTVTIQSPNDSAYWESESLGLQKIDATTYSKRFSDVKELQSFEKRAGWVEVTPAGQARRVA